MTDLGGAASADVWFEWGLTTAYGNTTTANTKLASGVFSDAIDGLAPSTIYHFRAVAQNTVGISYGIDRNFPTTPIVVAPTVLTSLESNVTNTSAQLNGNLTDLGGAASADVWFEWEETAVEPAIYNNTLSSPGSPKDASDTFFANLSGLASDTDYYFRAVAKNTAETSYGDGEHFTTAVAVFPSAIGLSHTGDTKEMYCLKYATTTGAVVNGRGGAVDFSWTYHFPGGSSMQSFLFQASTSPFPTTDLVVNVDISRSASHGATVTYPINVCSEADCGTIGSNTFAYDQDYYWRVEVCSGGNSCSGWVEAGALARAEIPNHRAPEPNFSWTVLEPAADKTAQFCSIKEGDCSAMLDADESVCYNTSNQAVSCSDARDAGGIKWTIPASAEFVATTTATDANPKIKFTELGDNEVLLEITGSGPCAAFHEVPVSSLPTWIEDDPFK